MTLLKKNSDLKTQAIRIHECFDYHRVAEFYNIMDDVKPCSLYKSLSKIPYLKMTLKKTLDEFLEEKEKHGNGFFETKNSNGWLVTTYQEEGEEILHVGAVHDVETLCGFEVDENY